MKFNMVLCLIMLLSLSAVTRQDTGLFESKQAIQERTGITFEDKDRNVLATGSDLDKDSFKVVVDRDGGYSVAGQFKDKEKLKYITQKVLGEELPIYCNGELVVSPGVSSVITSGEFAIAMDRSLGEAMQLVKYIKEANN